MQNYAKFSGGTLSIHDLTRRSTCFGDPAARTIQLSIHDLTRRSTLLCLNAVLVLSSFNSRPHKEVDYNTELILQ